MANATSVDLTRAPARSVGGGFVGAKRTSCEPLYSKSLYSALLLACLLVPLTLFMFKALSDRSAAVAQAQRDAADMADIFEQQAFTAFETFDLAAGLLNERIGGVPWDGVEQSADLSRYLSSLVARYRWVGGVSLLDDNGALRLSTLSGAERAGLSADSAVWAGLRNGADSSFIGLRGLPDNGDHLSIARRRTMADGSFGGITVISAPCSFFTDLWRRGAPEDVTLLFRTDGTLLARYPPSGRGASRASVGQLLLAATHNADRGSLVSFSGIDGNKRLIAYEKVAGYPVYLAHAVPMSRVLQHWRETSLRDGFFFLLAAGSLSLLALAVTRHSRREARAIELLLQRTGELTSEAERRAQAEADLGAVLRDTVERQEAERKHLARELHDSLGQHVAVLHMGLEGILQRATDPAGLREQVCRLKTTATSVSVEIGRLAWELRPAGLDELGLEAGLRSFVETTSRRSGLQIDLHIHPSDFRLNAAVEATLYRVVQEAVTNIIKHAEASRADIVVEITRRRAKVIIEDDGRGFVWEESSIRRRGERLGLLGVRERLSLVGGSLEIESSPGNGATLFIDVPA